MDNDNPLAGGNFKTLRAVSPKVSSSGGKKAYLENQIEILRREGTGNLHESIIAYRKCAGQLDERDTFTYTHVFIKGCTLTDRKGVAFRLEFSTANSRFKVNWETSNRLRQGTIVALTPCIEGFRRKCIIAVVANRTGVFTASPPHIDVFFANPDEAEINPSTEFVMIESRNGYYESVRHAIDGLRKACSETSPLDKYIIGGVTDVNRPSYLDELAENGACIKSCLADPDREIEIDELIHAIAGKGDLDPSQICAVKNVLDSDIAIIQGPPGTGKTFTAVTILRLLVDIQQSANSTSSYKGPVIVAAQSNYALDQLLLRCNRAGIKLCRIGARTRDEKIRSLSIFNIRNSGAPLRWRLNKESKRLEKEFQTLVNDTFFNEVLDPADLHKAGILTDEQFGSLFRTESSQTPSEDRRTPLSEWLAEELISFKVCYPSLDQEDFPMEEDGQMENEFRDIEEPLRGQWYDFKLSWTGYIHPDYDRSWMPRARECLSVPDLWSIPDGQRGGVYVYLQQKWFEHQAVGFREFLKKYELHVSLLKQDVHTADAHDIRANKIQIIGCTTTGLGKYRPLLEKLDPRILLVEEAAETWEANVTSALFPSLQHLILVGDHIQLTPTASVAELASPPYDLNISLFQRLIIQGHPITTLQVQRRMIPEIRGIVDPFYGNILEDDASVLTRDPIVGMKYNLFWIHHRSEDRTNAIGSKYNEEEAQYVVGLFRYLVQNGVEANRITMLTFYRAQQSMILKKLGQDPIIGAIVGDDRFQVRTVDGYQGEENDIVILSLVRTTDRNSRPSLGFLDSKNRVVVAMSRARSGFYIVGDTSNVVKAGLWAPIVDYFSGKGLIERSLLLKCQRHGHETAIKNLEGWTQVVGGGCGELCTETICSAGHACKRPCHAKPHEEMHCTARCEKILECGHKCIKACGDDFCECHQGHIDESSLPRANRPHVDFLGKVRDNWVKQANQTSSTVKYKQLDHGSNVGGPKIIETYTHRPIKDLLPWPHPVGAPTRSDESVVVEGDPAMWEGLRYFEDIDQELEQFEANVDSLGRDRAIAEEISRFSASEEEGVWARTLIDY